MPIHARGSAFLVRIVFIISIAINAMLLTLIASGLIATYVVEPGEAQQELAVFWALSLPGTLAVAGVSGVAYRAYLRQARAASATVHYMLLVLGTALVGPSASYAIAIALLALGDALAPT